MKHKKVTDLLRNPDNILAEDIAQYAIFNTSDNDNAKFQNIVELIVQYSQSISRLKNQQYIHRIKELENHD